MQARLLLLVFTLFLVTPFMTMAQQMDGEQPAKPSKPKAKLAPTQAKKAAPDVKAHLLERIKDWSVFIYEGAEGRVCFAASAPTDMQPKTTKRTPVIFYVTTWQKDGVKNEVSVKQGYPMKTNAVASVSVGGQTFLLSALDDKVYPKDSADERKLLSAMAAGGPMIVKATSTKGTATTDEYSLDGVVAAVQKLEETCP